MDLKYELVVVREHPDQLTLSELASLAGADPDTIRYYIDIGLVEPVSRVGAQLLFDANAVRRLKVVARLRRDLGASISSLTVIMDLVDRIRVLQHEVEVLRSRM